MNGDEAHTPASDSAPMLAALAARCVNVIWRNAREFEADCPKHQGQGCRFSQRQIAGKVMRPRCAMGWLQEDDFEAPARQASDGTPLREHTLPMPASTLDQWQTKLLAVAWRLLRNDPAYADKAAPGRNFLEPLIRDMRDAAEVLKSYGERPPDDLAESDLQEEYERAARLAIEDWLGAAIWRSDGTPFDQPRYADVVAALPAVPDAAQLPAAAGPWAAASGIDHFLESIESTAAWLVPNIIAREAVTVIASPRGLGKTNLAYAWAILLARAGFRVLLIDRDNPKSEIRRRLKAWGGAGLGDRIKIIARDQAPPLTDKSAWAAFPYADYDFVILDSISAATEGVEEGDGGKAGAGLAPLLDAARKGPAVLLLANTTKDGLKVRGSGTLSDRADLVFEVRDATDLKLESKHEVWWAALPDSAEHMWSDRAKRRRRRDSYRLALVTSKFRLGEEPDPSAFEMHHDSDPWSVLDVTIEIERALEETKRQAKDEAQEKIDIAAAALRKVLPIAKNPDALDILAAHGLSRNGARRLLTDRIGRDWIITGKGSKISPYIVELAAGMYGSPTPTETMVSDNLIPAGQRAQGWQESIFKNGSLPRTSEAPHSCRSNQERGVSENENSVVEHAPKDRNREDF